MNPRDISQLMQYATPSTYSFLNEEYHKAGDARRISKMNEEYPHLTFLREIFIVVSISTENKIPADTC